MTKLNSENGMKKVLFLVLTTLLVFSNALNAQHNWTFNAGDYGNSREIDAVVVLNSTEVTSGTLGAFVGDECRGFVDGLYFTPTGKTIFLLLCYSNESSGEQMQLKYYDDVNDKVYAVSESYEFITNVNIGSAAIPEVLNAVVNTSPVANCPDFSTLSHDAGPHDFDLEAIFTDQEGDVLTYTAMESAGVVSWLDASNVRFEPAALGTSSLTLTASDAEYTVSCDYTFTIDPGNEAPQLVNAISDFSVEEGYVSVEIDLDTVFSDSDMDVLSYSVLSSNTGVATVSVNADKLVISEVSGGNTRITVSASDGRFSAEDAFNFIVFSVAPAIPWEPSAVEFLYKGTIITEVFVNGEALSSGVLAAFVGDECRGKTEASYFAPTGKSIFSLDIQSSQAQGEFMTFRYYQPLTGAVKKVEEFIEFKPDMQLGSAALPYALNIQDINHVPILSNPILDFSVEEHFTTRTISLVDVFSDPDDDALTYLVEVDDLSVASAVISGTDLIISEVAPGETYMTVSASDGEYVKDNFFEFTINDVNDAPVLTNPINNLDLDEGFRSVSVDISKVFVDPEGDPLTYSALIDDELVITSYFEGSNLIIREVGLGTAILTLCASDLEFETCHDITVNVAEVNNPPEIDCAAFVDTSMLVGTGSFVIENLIDSVYDEEGDDLAFSASSSVLAVATVIVSDGDLVISEEGIGVTNIEFCVSDGVSNVCCSFEFAIEEENEIILSYNGTEIGYQDSIMLTADMIDLMINVSSGVEWSFLTYSEWILNEIIDEGTLKLTCSENKTGEWRMGLAIVKDVQGHTAQFYVHQSEFGTGIFSGSQGYSNLMIYPNPVSDLLSVSGEGMELGEYEIVLMDNSGKIILKDIRWNVGSEGISLDVSDLSEGIYYLRLKDAKGVINGFPFVKAGR